MYLSLTSIGPLYCLKTWSNPGKLSFWVLEIELSITKHYNTNFDHLLLRGGGGALLPVIITWEFKWDIILSLSMQDLSNRVLPEQ